MTPLRVVAVLAFVATLAACGGGDGGSGTSDAEFCEYLNNIEDIDVDAAPEEALAAIDEIIDRAPNSEIKGALQDLRPIFETMSSIDPNDEAAFEEMMAIMFDPKVIAAGEVLEKYGVEVCGFKETSGDTPLDTSNDLPSDPGIDVEPTALEDLESSDISDAVEAVLADVSSEAFVASSGWSSMGAGFSVEVDISGISEIDGVPLCEAVAELLFATDPDAEFTISVTLDGKPIATSNMDNCLGLIR